MFQPYFRCVGISRDTSWQDIDTAPRDGTPIELENCYGIRPSYSLCKWADGEGWTYANDDSCGVGDGPWLRWRPYSGEPAKYIDPTNGFQASPAYWR